MKEDLVRLLLVDENAAVRRALVLRLSRAQDIQIIGATGSFEAAMTTLVEQHPDVLILESKRRDGGALKFCRQVLEMTLPPRIVILTSFPSEDERLSFAHLGINQYLLKDIDTEELIRVVRREAQQIRLRST
ncbi:MAG: response regulator transcription factor [Anaerolineae bacterium]|nr:response regulator transcription factor [Anaerolineae bacterium]